MLVVLTLQTTPVMAQSAPPAIPEDTLVVRVMEGSEGRRVRVEGSGFAASRPVELLLVGSNRTSAGSQREDLPTPLATVTTDSSGAFTTTIEVSSEVPDDWYLLEARGENPDGTPQVMARDVRIGSTSTGDQSLFAALQWVGYSLVLFALAALGAVATRRIAARREDAAP